MNVGELQRSLSRKAEREPKHQFGDLYSLLGNMNWLRLAHAYVAPNAGSKTAGCDGLDMYDFEHDLELNLQKLREALQAKTFVPCPVRRVYLPKAKGGYRPLGIPSIRDRIVQEGLRMLLEPIYEADFRQVSFGFRPNRCTMDAIKRIKLYTIERNKYFWVIEGDIASYFDTVHHRKLMKLLGRRIQDRDLLDLIWKFLKAGVMERTLFLDTSKGVPQGGIVSPLLANVYLHELDQYMATHTDLSKTEKDRRRQSGQANFAYVRYADDFVILSNGRREYAEAMREAVRRFLADHLRLTLSMEKTRITHLNDGFEFLGFRLQRGTGPNKMVTKFTIPEKAIDRHLSTLKAALAPETHAESVTNKIKALNRYIAGWSRYYQYTTKATIQFGKLRSVTFWLFARWLGHKFRLSIPQVLRRHLKGNTFADGDLKLTLHSDFKHQVWSKPFVKPNPYTTQEPIHRDQLVDDDPWRGQEGLRAGWADIRRQAMERDGYACRLCQAPVTPDTCEVDHISPVWRFKRPVDANTLANAWTLCIPCHRAKTKFDWQRESPVP
jgi:RNA-directed DNA polymerase